MDLTKIIDVIKLPIRYIVSILVMASILLFASDNLLAKIGLDGFSNDYKKWIGLVFVVTFSISLISGIVAVWNKVNRSMTQRNNLKARKERLHNLTYEEKDILAYFIHNQTRSQKLQITDGTVRELEAYKIISRTSQLGDLYSGFSYNIQPWAWDYLNKYKELLD